MKRLYIIATLVFSVAILVYAAIKWQMAEEEDKTSVVSTITPDFVAEELETNIYNKEGKLSHTINAQRMEHYTDLAVTNFEYPKYTLYPNNHGAAWYLSANEGTLQHNNRVRLENRVTLTASDNNSMIQAIYGKNVELDLNKNIISSDQMIMIQGKDFTTYGSGLIVDLNTTQMTLTEHVQTIYKKNLN